MSEEKIKPIILCSWGATSSQLAKKVQQAAEQRGIQIEVDAGGPENLVKMPVSMMWHYLNRKFAI